MKHLGKLEYEPRASKQNLCHWMRKSYTYCGKRVFLETQSFSKLQLVLMLPPKVVPNTELSDTGKLPDHCSRANWTMSYLCYLEDWLQKSSRWSKMSQNQTKKVIQHANTANPSRCPVRLFQTIQQLEPN